jgi:hypothetical protein
MVLFVPVELPVPVGEMGREVVPLGVTVVIDPPLSTETNGRADDTVEEAEVIAGEGVVETDIPAVEDVCGATAINHVKERTAYLYLRMSRWRRMKYLVEALERHCLQRPSMQCKRRQKQLDNALLIGGVSDKLKRSDVTRERKEREKRGTRRRR